jgi:hypothetical protein
MSRIVIPYLVTVQGELVPFSIVANNARQAAILALHERDFGTIAKVLDPDGVETAFQLTELKHGGIASPTRGFQVKQL